jgi:hypothetical protein
MTKYLFQLQVWQLLPATASVYVYCMFRFINRDDVDFSLVETAAPVQEWDLQEDTHRVVLEYPTMYGVLFILC